MNDSHITVNGVPLDVALAWQKSAEISNHLRTESSAIAARCGVRRASTRRAFRLGRSGRPKKGISLLLLQALEAFLRDDSYSLAGISELFQMTMGEVRFYLRFLGIKRKRGRKSCAEQRRDG